MLRTCIAAQQLDSLSPAIGGGPETVKRRRVESRPPVIDHVGRELGTTLSRWRQCVYVVLF